MATSTTTVMPHMNITIQYHTGGTMRLAAMNALSTVTP